MLLSLVLIIMSIGATAWTGKHFSSSVADEELMLRYMNGDLRAFESLYERHRKPVFNFILRYVKSPERAEELMQEVFMRLVQSAQKYTKQAKFTTWLYTIARNLCIDVHRKTKNRRMVSIQQTVGESEDGTTLEQLLSGLTTEGQGEEQVYYREVQKAVEAGLAELPDEQREVLLLREVSQLPYKEIASIVGTLENTVKSRMRYALESLRRHLESAGFSAKDLT